MHCNQELPWLTTTRESPRSATKTQCYQNKHTKCLSGRNNRMEWGCRMTSWRLPHRTRSNRSLSTSVAVRMEGGRNKCRGDVANGGLKDLIVDLLLQRWGARDMKVYGVTPFTPGSRVVSRWFLDFSRAWRVGHCKLWDGHLSCLLSTHALSNGNDTVLAAQLPSSEIYQLRSEIHCPSPPGLTSHKLTSWLLTEHSGDFWTGLGSVTLFWWTALAQGLFSDLTSFPWSCTAVWGAST